MVDDKRLKKERADYALVWGKHPEAAPVLEAWEKTLENPTYQDYIKKKTQLLFEGYSPMPDLEAHSALIRSTGHEMAAADVLKGASILGQLFLGRSANIENYHAVHVTVACRLWQGPGHTFGGRELQVLYSTLDRLLRGGKDWHKIVRVPTASRPFYEKLYHTRNSVIYPASLCETVQMVSRAHYGEQFAKVVATAIPAQDLLTTAAAVKNGHPKATLDDAFEAMWAYLRLFEQDLDALPLVVREGSSGYEQVPVP